MLNNPFFSTNSRPLPFNTDLITPESNLNIAKTPPTTMDSTINTPPWRVFMAAAFLVSVPVFIQAPLVRQWPFLSLALTPIWVAWGWWLYQRPACRTWGDLLLGFSWSWLAGTIYWGWLRTEPYWHLPVEAIGLPFCLWCLRSAKIGNLGDGGKDSKTDFLTIGSWFYLGSLWGTVLTDGYFYVNNLIPYWRAIMAQEPSLAVPILHQAIAQVNNPRGWISALFLLCILLFTGLQPLKSLNQVTLNCWAFSGAVLSTILVDGLFWLVAFLA